MIGLNGPELFAVVVSVVAAPYALCRLWVWATAADDLRPLERNRRRMERLGGMPARANSMKWEDWG